MTVVVVWYRERFQELWCAADTRISGGNGVLTDHGPKIFSIPVVCHAMDARTKRWAPVRRHTFGFSFAGSTLAANGTHALASACTQSLAAHVGTGRLVSVEAIANLYKVVAQRQITDLSMRMGAREDLHRYFFEGAVFGYCLASRRFKAYAIAPNLAGGAFTMVMAELLLEGGRYHPFGSGAERFVELDRELAATHNEPGVMTTLREMVVRGAHPEVGGHFQIGVGRRSGFELSPVLNAAPGPGQATVTFLGWDVGEAPDVDGHRIGFGATRIDY